MDILNKNFKAIRQFKGWTQQQMADELGIKRASVGAYEEGRARPNIRVQRKLAEMLDLSLDDLLTKNLEHKGNRYLLEEDNKETDTSGRKLRTLTTTIDKEGRNNIELVQQKAAAGYLNGYADPEFIEELPRFNLPMLPQGTYRAFEITGDSMLPLRPGSIVIGEYEENWHDIKDGQTYIVVSRTEGVVYKRVFNKLDESDELILRSDNTSYSPFTLKAKDIVEVWKAKLFISQAGDEQNMSMEKLTNMVMDLQQEVIRLREKE